MTQWWASWSVSLRVLSSEPTWSGVVVAVDGTEVEVLPVVVLTAELAPGCSFATTTPMSAVAPAAPTIEARVRYRTSALARCLASGEL